jgi:cytochrome P450
LTSQYKIEHPSEEKLEMEPNFHGELAREMLLPHNLSEPHAIWRRLRHEAPVIKLPMPGPRQGVYAISRKADIEQASRNWEQFSSDVVTGLWRWEGERGRELRDIGAKGYDRVNTIVVSDPPRAHRYRKIALEALSPARVKRRSTELQAGVDALLDMLPDGEAIDFRDKFAVPYPLRAILAVFGLGLEYEEEVYRASRAQINFVDPISDFEQMKSALREIVDAQHMLAAKINQYRKAPADNFLSFIANVQDADGQMLSIPETLSMALTTLVGGNETTRNTLSTAVLALARDRDLWTMLVENPDKVGRFVEEIIRFGTPLKSAARRVAQDVVLHDTPISEGAILMLLWGSGSHDETAFEDPEQIRLDRPNASAHTSFGGGVHLCAGAYMARLEVELAIKGLIERFAEIELAVDDDDIVYDASFMFRALPSVPLRLKRRRG